LVIPHIETLSSAIITHPNAIALIADNPHIETLAVNSGLHLDYEGAGYYPITSFDGLEKFDKIDYLETEDPVYDLSALSGCLSLEELYIKGSLSVKSLEPLYGLENLDYITMSIEAYRALPEAERARFNMGNDDALDAPNIFFL
jgi:hypothetical protein